MGKKSRRPRAQGGSAITERTEPERRAEAAKIVGTLTELGLTTTYAAVKELLTVLATYTKEGERIEVNIPIPEIGRRAVGVLATSKREGVWLKLEKCS